ncbi:MAG: TonB family protein [Spirochaetia bacterium]|jgi:TonB family protein
MEAHRAFPWVVSLLLHAGLLLVPVSILLAPVPKTAAALGGVDVAIVASAGPGGEAAGAVASSTAAEIVRLPRPGIQMGKLPAAALPKVSSDLPNGVSPVEGLGSAASNSSIFQPAAQDVLADAAAVSLTSPKTASATVAEGAQSPGTRIGWEGAPRRLIRKRDPQFPDVLSATGQEIEGEARITVAPSGVVTRVDITRSSGYTEIDASVEAALRDYLFSRVDGQGDAVGTVRFRFRLEKQD